MVCSEKLKSIYNRNLLIKFILSSLIKQRKHTCWNFSLLYFCYCSGSLRLYIRPTHLDRMEHIRVIGSSYETVIFLSSYSMHKFTSPLMEHIS